MVNDTCLLGARDIGVEIDACVLGARDYAVGVEKGGDAIGEGAAAVAIGVCEHAVGLEEAAATAGSADNRDTTKIGCNDLSTVEMHVCSHCVFLKQSSIDVSVSFVVAIRYHRVSLI